jgi:hypothetical protein
MKYDYPPYPYLQIIADNCPEAVSLYMKLWSKRDCCNQLRIERIKAKNEFSMPLKKFRQLLNLICDERLLSYAEVPCLHKCQFEFFIEIVDWQFESEGQVLC